MAEQAFQQFWKPGRRIGAIFAGVALATALIVVVASQASGGPDPQLKELRERFTTHTLSPDAQRVAEAITSVFENSTTELQYGYSVELDDGRGVTAGRAGFTSGTGDLV